MNALNPLQISFCSATGIFVPENSELNNPVMRRGLLSGWNLKRLKTKALRIITAFSAASISERILNFSSATDSMKEELTSS